MHVKNIKIYNLNYMYIDYSKFNLVLRSKMFNLTFYRQFDGYLKNHPRSFKIDMNHIDIALHDVYTSMY